MTAEVAVMPVVDLARGRLFDRFAETGIEAATVLYPVQRTVEERAGLQ